MANPFIAVPTVVLAGVLLVCAVLATVRFILWQVNEFEYARHVCPIWSNTLNVLLDSDIEIVDYGTRFTIAGVNVQTDGYGRELGDRYDTGQRVDRATQKRLREHTAKKDAIAILEKAEKEFAA